MTKEHFDAQMGLIMQTFGTENYPKPRNITIWESCHDLSDKSFAYIVKTFIRTRRHNQPPLPIDFEEAAHSQRKIVNNYANEKLFNQVDERHPEKLDELLHSMGASNIDEAVRDYGKLKLIKPSEGA